MTYRDDHAAALARAAALEAELAAERAKRRALEAEVRDVERRAVTAERSLAKARDVPRALVPVRTAPPAPVTREVGEGGAVVSVVAIFFALVCAWLRWIL